GSARISSGDFDADGNLDILFAQGSRYDFLLGDGAGGFSPGTGGAQVAAGGILGFSVAMLDGDSADDAIFLQRAGGLPPLYELQTLLSTTAELQLDPTQLDFGQVELGSTSAPESILISSTGERRLEIESLSIVGSNPDQFTVDRDECSGQQVSPGTNCAVTVVFEPLDAGNQSAQLEVLSNASTSPDSITLSGEGILVNQPFLDLTPEAVDFGDVAIGGSSNRTTTVENIGTAALTIGNLSLSGSAANDYTLNVDNCSSTALEPGEACTYNVGVAPSQTGLREALIEIPSNAFSSPDQQTYTATGVEAPVITFEPGGFDFGEVPVGMAEESGELLVKNTGSADLIINFIEVQGADADDFSLTVDNCSGATVVVSESCSFELSFTPSDVGSQGPAVAVDSNLDSRRFFFVSGEGINADSELDLMPDSIGFGIVAGDAASDVASVIFSNPGSGPLT
ncbi:MAG TPA: choice-of-anchor D domain-containing protein, partial [Tichowtungia sp.]|nr:choice-of-anchor D domain-containing protein [Tichowtungia sp.]